MRAQHRVGWALGWVGAVGVAIGNAALRQPIVRVAGEKRAHQISSVTLLVLLAPWVAHVQRRNPLASSAEAITVGAAWAVATVTFEFVFGHYVNHDSWHDLLAAYNLREGNLWSLDVLAIAAAPAVARAATRHR